MTRRTILLASLLSIVVVAAILVWRRDSIIGTVERRLASAVISLVPIPLEIGRLEFRLFPFGIDLTEVAIHLKDETPVRVSSIAGTVALGASLWEGQWIVDLRIDRPELVFSSRNRWWESLRFEGSADDQAPAGRLRSITIHSAKATLALDEPSVQVTLDDLEGEGRWRGMLSSEFAFEVSARGEIKSTTASHPIEALDLVGVASTSGVRMDRGRVAGGQTEVEFAGSIDGKRLDGEVRGNLELGAIGALVPKAGIHGGAGKVRARIEGGIGEPTIDADLSVAGLKIGAIELSGVAPLKARGLDWSLGPGKVQIFDGEVDATASGRLAPEVPYVLAGRIRGWNARAFLRAIDAEVPLLGRLDGDAEIRGRLLADEVAGSGSFRVHRDERELPGEIEFQVTDEGAELRASLGSESAPMARADLTFADANRGEIVLEAFDLADAAPFVGAPLRGRLQGKATFGGQKGAPRLDGNVAIDALAFDEIPIGRVSGPFTLDASGIASPALALEDLSAQLEGHLPWDASNAVAWRLRVEDGDLVALTAIPRVFGTDVKSVEGRMNATMEGSGSLNEPRIVTEWATRDAVIGKLALGELRGHFAGTASDWKLDSSARRGDLAGSARVSLSRSRDQRLQGTASISDWALAGLDLPLRNSGALTAEGTIAGSWTRPIVRATFALADWTIAERSIGAASGSVGFRDDRLSGTIAVDSRFSATLDADAAWPHAFKADARWTALAVRAEEAGAEDALITSSGTLKLGGDVERPLHRGMGRIDSLRVDHPAAHLESPGTWNVTISDGVVSVRDAELRGEGQRIAGAGQWSRDLTRLSVTGEGSLALAEGLIPGLVSARGQATIDIEAWRPAGQTWKMKGKAKVEDAAADLGVLVGLSDVDGEVDLDDEGLLVRELTGDLGGGRFGVDGRVDRSRGFALRWHLHRASLGIPAWLDHRVTGEGSVDGAFEQPVVHGSLRVEQAIYDRDIEWSEFVPWFRREAREATIEGGTPIGFDLRILADDGLFIENNLAAVELSADLRLGGTGARPTLVGRVDVVDGTIDFRGRKFSLTSGTIVFDEAHLADPTLEILGETSVRTPEQEVEIDLRVSGRATEPRIEFVADDPSFTQNDVLALVTFGRTVSQLQTGGAGISLDEVLSLTAGPRADRFERRLHTLLPVDRIEIEPAYSRITGSTEPKLRIGKDMTPSLRKTPLGEALRGPLRASAGSSLGAGREQDVTLEYGLTAAIALLGSWQSDTESGAGAFGGDIKFRRQFWGLSGFSLLPETMPDGLLSLPRP